MNGNKENASYTVWVATAQGELFYYNSSLDDESDASHRSRIQGINVEILNIRLRFPKIEDAQASSTNGRGCFMHYLFRIHRH